MTTASGAQEPTHEELKYWVGVALSTIKARVRPRVTFGTLATAADVSERTAKRQFDGERDIRVPELYGFATALNTTPDAVYAEALRLWGQSRPDALEEEARHAMSAEEWAEVQKARQGGDDKATRRSKRKGA